MTHRAAVAPPRDVDVTDTPASLGRRFLAVALDQVLLAVLLLPFTLDAVRRAVATAGATDPSAVAVAPVGAGGLVALVLAAAVAVAQWVLHGRLGWTLGRRLLGVRTVDVHSRRPVGVLRVLLRELVVAAGALACLVGQVAVLVSPALDRTGRNRGWHDRAVDAEVLVARAGARPARPRPAAPAAAGATLPVSGPLSAGDPGAPVTAGADAGGGPGEAAPTPGGSRPTWAAPGRADASTPDPSTPDASAPSAASSGPGAAARGAVPPTRPAGGVPAHARTVPATTGGLVLPPLDPPRAAPDLDTRALPLVRAATPPPAPTAVDAAPGASDDDGLAPELELTRPAPPRADVLPAQRRGPVRGLRVALDDGRTVTIERVALLGRNPSPAPGVQVVRVTDPGRSVSKTHLELGADASGAWVTDRGSTNGTVVTLPDGAQVVCRVDHPVRLRAGAVVVLGDRSLRVVAVPGTSVADVLRADGTRRAEGTSRA